MTTAEREAPDQIEAADTLMAALSDAMIALHGFEHAPVPPAARRWATAQQMSAQMADAIAAFLALPHENSHSNSKGEPHAITDTNRAGLADRRR